MWTNSLIEFADGLLVWRGQKRLIVFNAWERPGDVMGN